jgi:TRAP transporter 4TM/12TM fusion protein
MQGRVAITLSSLRGIGKMTNDNEETSKKNSLKKFISYNGLYTTACLIYVFGILAFAILMFEPREELILLYLPFTLIILLLDPHGKTKLWFGKMKEKVFLFFIVLLLLSAAVYLRSQYTSLLFERLGDYNNTDYFFSIILIVITIILTWLEYGIAIPLMTLLALFYAYFGKLFPGILNHAGLSIARILTVSSIEFTCGDGVLGSLPQIGITWIAIFTIFAGIAFGFGVLEFIIKITYNMFKKYRYGVPQIAVISSLIFGSFSGSGAANVAGTGTFTIPLMKRYGMPGYVAGAIESVASSGGQVMPPVMGAAAFLMASYLGIFYWNVVLIGFLPALIFYANVALAVHIHAKQNLNLSDRVSGDTEIPKLKKIEILYDGFPAAAAIVVLMVILVVFMTDVMIAGFFMIVTFLVLTFVMELIRSHNNLKFFFREFLKKLLSGVRSSAQSTASITTMIACIGIIVAILIQTGLAQKLSFAIVKIAGNNEIILILLVAGLCILFGMTATTVAAYILTVTLAAPVLNNMGVPNLVTHFFVFYYAMIGLITPPVAPCCAVASGLAKDSFLKICWYSIKIGLPMFILPFSFFVHQGIIIHDSSTVVAAVLILLGMSALTFGTNLGYNGLNSLLKKAGYIIVGAFTLFYPHPAAGYFGMFLSALICIYEFHRLSSYQLR